MRVLRGTKESKGDTVQVDMIRSDGSRLPGDAGLKKSTRSLFEIEWMIGQGCAGKRAEANDGQQ
jgi:hypothetical protein